MNININEYIKDSIMLLISKRYFDYGFLTDLKVENNHVESIVNVLSKKYKVSFDLNNNQLSNIACSCGKDNCAHLGTFIVLL